MSGGACANPLSKAEIQQACTFNLFDASLGILTGAKLNLGGSYQTHLTIKNNSGQAQSATASINGVFHLTPPAELSTGSNPFRSLALGPYATGPIAPGATADSGFLNDTSSLDFLYSGADLSFFTSGAPGTFSIIAESHTSLTLNGGGGNLSVNQATIANFFGNLQYTYDPREFAPGDEIPVPGSLPIAGAAAAFGISRRLRRRINGRTVSS